MGVGEDGERARWEGDAWLRLLSPVWSAVGLALSQLDFLVENDRFHNKIFKRDNAVVMLLALFDLGGQLAMRVIPLAVLMDVYWQLGIGCFGGAGGGCSGSGPADGPPQSSGGRAGPMM